MQIIRQVCIQAKLKVKTMMLIVRLHQGEMNPYVFARGLVTATTHYLGINSLASNVFIKH